MEIGLNCTQRWDSSVSSTSSQATLASGSLAVFAFDMGVGVCFALAIMVYIIFRIINSLTQPFHGAKGSFFLNIVTHFA